MAPAFRIVPVSRTAPVLGIVRVLLIPGGGLVPGKSQVLQDLGNRVTPIQNVEVYARNVIVPQLFHLPGCKLDAQLPGCGIVVRTSLQFTVQIWRQLGPAQRGKPADLGGAQDGEDARDNRDVDTSFLGPFPEIKEIAVVVKELGDQEIHTLIHLEMGVLQVDRQIP